MQQAPLIPHANWSLPRAGAHEHQLIISYSLQLDESQSVVLRVQAQRHVSELSPCRTVHPGQTLLSPPASSSGKRGAENWCCWIPGAPVPGRLQSPELAAGSRGIIPIGSRQPEGAQHPLADPTEPLGSSAVSRMQELNHCQGIFISQMWCLWSDDLIKRKESAVPSAISGRLGWGTVVWF